MDDKKDSNKKRKNLWNIQSLKDSSVGLLLDPISIEMKSNREAIIEGCKSIAQYDENVITVNMDKMMISFFGRNMEIKCMNSDSMVIRGVISSIEFNT